MAGGGQILVIRGGAIGDFILTLPVFKALRDQFPQSPLSVLGYPHIANLALAGGLVDEVRSIEARALAGFFATGAVLSDELTAYFARFAVIVSYLYDPDEIFRTNVTRCTGAQFIAGPHRPNEHSRTHATEVFLEPLQRLAIFGSDAAPRLELRSDSGQTEDPVHGETPNCRRLLAVHPGSGSERKNWPEWRWAELLSRLVETTDWKVLVVGGEAEGDRLARLAAGIPPGRVEPAKNLPLPDLARRLRACAGYIGHDSGISHLAAAVGLPGIILWGDSNENIWRPRSDKMTVLRDPAGLTALPVARVLQAMEETQVNAARGSSR